MRTSLFVCALAVAALTTALAQVTRPVAASAPKTDMAQFSQWLRHVMQEAPTGFERLRGPLRGDLDGDRMWVGAAIPTKEDKWTCKTWENLHGPKPTYTYQCFNQDIGPPQASNLEAEGKMLAALVKDILGKGWTIKEYPEKYGDDRPNSRLDASNPAMPFDVMFKWAVHKDHRGGNIEAIIQKK